VQPYWPGLFASLLSNRINDLLYSVGGGGGGGGSSAAASASSAPAGDGMLVYSIDHLVLFDIYACLFCYLLVFNVMNQACAIHFAAMIAIHTTLSISSLLSVHLPIMKCIYHIDHLVAISSSISYHCYCC
jgi:hypothetical protein